MYPHNFISQRITILVATIILISNGDLLYGQCHPDDFVALKALYDNTDGDNWSDTSGWTVIKLNATCPSGLDLSTLEGISIDANDRVFELILDRNDLSGSIPPELESLSNLSIMDLGSNSLIGSIPSELGNLSLLQVLEMDSNELSGDIPSELGNLSNLLTLNLRFNDLSGSIPPELGNLSKLQELDFHANRTTGMIPPELGNLSNLEILNFRSNDLTGNIPPELGNLLKLHTLDLYWNELNGNIPPELGNLSNLEILNLSLNDLTGNIPPELGNLSNLHILDLRRNELTGNIPLELGNLSNLLLLDLSLANLAGEIPDELGNLLHLQELRLNNNGLTGSIPPVLGNLTSLISLTLYNNDLSGCYPYQLINICHAGGSAAISNGNNFDATWDEFCSVDDGICACDSDFNALKILYYSTNGDNWDDTTGWTIIKDNITCPVGFEFSTIYGISVNDITGRIDSINLRNNNLVGTLPDELSLLQDLQYINLSKNNISGTIPNTLGSMSNLEDVRFHQNDLTGSIPTDGFPKLRVYSISDNNLQNGIPRGIGNIISLEEIWLSNNPNLGGTVPEEIGFLRLLNTLQIGNCNLSGCFPPSWSGLCSKLTNAVIDPLNNFDNTYSQLCSGLAQTCDYCDRTTKIFTANQNELWSDTRNWNTLCLPEDGDTVVILEDRYFKVDIDDRVKHLVLTEGAIMEISSNRKLEISTAVENGFECHGNLINNGTLEIKECGALGLFATGKVINNGTLSFTLNTKESIWHQDSLVNNNTIIITDTRASAIACFGDFVNEQQGFIRVSKVSDEFGKSSLDHDGITLGRSLTMPLTTLLNDPSLINYGSIEIDSVYLGINNSNSSTFENHGELDIVSSWTGIYNIALFINKNNLLINAIIKGVENIGTFSNIGGRININRDAFYEPDESGSFIGLHERKVPLGFLGTTNDTTGVISISQSDEGIKLSGFGKLENSGTISLYTNTKGLKIESNCRFFNLANGTVRIFECAEFYIEVDQSALLEGYPEIIFDLEITD